MNMLRFIPRALLALALIAAALWLAFHHDQINVDALNAWIDQLGNWSLVAYVAAYAVATVMFVPGVIFGLAGGALFGPILGSVLNLTGATLGATLAFLVARYVAGGCVPKIRFGVDAGNGRGKLAA